MSDARAESRAVGRGLLPIDWGKLTGLRLQAKVIAEGIYTGAHRSRRHGAGIEYGGQRPYVPGDDLRFLDRRSLLKHDRYMVRQFETETDRAMWLCVDDSASMSFRTEEGLGAKLAYAAVVAAALARVALLGQDPVGLTWLSGAGRQVPASSADATFDRVVDALESAGATEDLSDGAVRIERATRALARWARRGSIIVVLSDLLDLPPRAERSIAALAAGPRALLVVQVLDPAERDLSFHGKVRLRSLEGKQVVETDVDAVRAEYKVRLAELQARWRRTLEGHGGRLLLCSTADEPAAVVRQVVQTVAQLRR